MVLTDNTVALRQLELANAALLSATAVHTPEGKSIAKDGKFHPRVFTLVGLSTLVEGSATHTSGRVATTLSLFLCSVVSRAFTGP